LFTDPLVVAYDGSNYNLPRAMSPSASGLVSSSFYDAVSGLSVLIERSVAPSLARTRHQFVIRKDYTDTTATDGVSPRGWGNGVGLVFDIDLSKYAAADVAKLRTAVVSLVSGTFQDRFLAGEG